MDFRGALPRTSELVALPTAVADLKKFTEYTEIMGSRAPQWALLITALDVTCRWSSARTQADAWDKYARTQEGISWTMLRRMMGQLAPIYGAVVAADPSIATMFPGLATLLDAKKVIAHRSASTKKANAKAKAEGREPTHGKVGKEAIKAAQRAALAEKLAAPSSNAPDSGAPGR